MKYMALSGETLVEAEAESLKDKAKKVEKEAEVVCCGDEPTQK
jgi:hypothetical protein